MFELAKPLRREFEPRVKGATAAARQPRVAAAPGFLWGPRQTGKSTPLKTGYPDAPWVDLLPADEFRRSASRPVVARVAQARETARGGGFEVLFR